MDSESLMMFTYSVWFLFGIPWVMLATYYLFVRYFPWREITWNFLAQFQLYRGVISMFVTSPCYVFFDVWLLVDHLQPFGDPNYQRDWTYLPWAFLISIAIIIHNYARIERKGHRYHLDFWEVVKIIGYMGRPGTTKDVFPPFYLVYCDLRR